MSNLTSLTSYDIIEHWGIDMSKSYSVYDAKARLSELLRAVKGGAEVIITERGIPIAKVCPLEPPVSFAGRLDSMRLTGQIQKRREPRKIPVVEERPGGLNRFLEERE